MDGFISCMNSPPKPLISFHGASAFSARFLIVNYDVNQVVEESCLLSYLKLILSYILGYVLCSERKYCALVKFNLSKSKHAINCRTGKKVIFAKQV